MDLTETVDAWSDLNNKPPPPLRPWPQPENEVLMFEASYVDGINAFAFTGGCSTQRTASILFNAYHAYAFTINDDVIDGRQLQLRVLWFVSLGAGARGGF